MFRYLVAGRQTRFFENNDELLTTQQAAALAGRSDECIRNWCREGGIGCYDGTLHRYFISKRKLTEYILKSQGALPHALKEAG